MSSKENSKIRINALLKELDRQQLKVRKRNNLIRIIVAVIILVSVVTFSFFYVNSDESVSPVVQVERKEGDLVKKEDLKPKFLKTYKLIFDGLNQYPLARFVYKENALFFQEGIKILHLPKTYISIDSSGRKKRVLALSSNYRYYVQVGVFKNQLIADLSQNMVYLHQIKDKNLYKYRLGPFTTSAQAKKLVKHLKLKDYLIVEVSK